MHRLIKRQIQRVYGKTVNIEQLSQAEQKLIEQVSLTYDENDKERRFLEHTLEVNTRELNEKADAVQRALSSLAEAQRLTRTGSWTYSVSNDHTEWSDELFRIAKVDPDLGPLPFEAVYEMVHPDDRARFDVEMQFLQEPNGYDGVYRLCFADGEVKYIHEYRVVVSDDDGNLQMVQGTVQDITAQRAAEEELRLFANVFHHSGEGILITDSSRNIVAVNKSLSEITGFELEQVVGQSVDCLFAQEMSENQRQDLKREMQAKGYWQGETIGLRSDGSNFPLWVTVSACRNESGCIDYYICSFLDITDRKASQERIHHLAHHDNLTGLINRFSLEQRLLQALNSAKRQNEKVALMFIDMDRFKVINDTQGHAAGDELLIEVAQRLKSSVRESDIVSRIGGDEFVVVYTGLKDSRAVMPLARYLIHQLSTPYSINGSKVFSSPSIGVSIYPSDADDGSTLLKNADTAMYQAKEAGRANYQFFTEAMNVESKRRMELESDLRYAVEHGQFELYFQPLISSGSGKIKAVEALVRWNHPKHGLISPDQFIPIAEETNLILPLGAWVLEQACRQQSKWRAQHQRRIVVSVNLSAQQLRSSDLVGGILDVITRYDMLEGDLGLEITESTAMANPAEAIKRLREIRELNVGLAIDDFGTGYSSLSYLKLLPINTLKLDRSFVRDLEHDDNNAMICAATLALAHNLGLSVVAEGVETEAQRDFLVSHGCEFLQGYLFSKPLPADQITEYILAH